MYSFLNYCSYDSDPKYKFQINYSNINIFSSDSRHYIQWIGY